MLSNKQCVATLLLMKNILFYYIKKIHSNRQNSRIKKIISLASIFRKSNEYDLFCITHRMGETKKMHFFKHCQINIGKLFKNFVYLNKTLSNSFT